MTETQEAIIKLVKSHPEIGLVSASDNMMSEVVNLGVGSNEGVLIYLPVGYKFSFSAINPPKLCEFKAAEIEE